MADDTNEDSWLYGTSNPDSTTGELGNGGDSLTAEHESAAAEAQALAELVAGEKPGASAGTNSTEDSPRCPKEEVPEYSEFDDPAQEMEEDEDALPNTDSRSRRERDRERDRGRCADRADARSSPDPEDDEMSDGPAARRERNGSGSDDDEDDDSDDDINVVIGDIKQAPAPTTSSSDPTCWLEALVLPETRPSRLVRQGSLASRTSKVPAPSTEWPCTSSVSIRLRRSRGESRERILPTTSTMALTKRRGAPIASARNASAWRRVVSDWPASLRM